MELNYRELDLVVEMYKDWKGWYERSLECLEEDEEFMEDERRFMGEVEELVIKIINRKREMIKGE